MILVTGSYFEYFYGIGSNFSESAGNRDSDLVELAVDELIGLHNEVGAGDKFESEAAVDTDDSGIISSRGLNEFRAERENETSVSISRAVLHLIHSSYL